MKFIAVKTRPILPPRDNIYKILDNFLPQLRERDVLFITSKILAIHQGRCVKITDKIIKESLIKKEAERYIEHRLGRYKPFLLTIKNFTLIPSAGIDESNSNGYYVLWPTRPVALARQICRYLKKKHKLKHFAVIITDSHTIPLRYGTLGISIGFWGLEPLVDYRGKPDIFGRKLKYTKANVIDAISSMGVLLMGEGSERTPMLILRDAPFVRFTDRAMHKSLVIPPEKDLYAPLLKIFAQK